jgi:hypothetical protein
MILFLESPIYDYSTLVNSISIFLEIIGFVFTIGVVRRIVRGDFVSDHYEPQVVSNPNPRFYY